MFPTRILLATDGSEGSARAARVATDLSNRLGSELHVALIGGRVPPSGTAHTWPPLDPEFERWARETLEREARERLEEQLGRIRAGGGEVSGAHARLGRADAGIVALADELGAGLVVVGSRGLGRLRRAVLGSVSRAVVRHAHCPVLVVRGGEEAAPLSGPILVAVDGSKEAAKALGAGAEISAATGAGLHVVHAIDPEPYAPYPGPEAWDGWEEDLERDARAARSWVEGEAERVRGGLETVEAHLVVGDPGREVSRLAGDLGAGSVLVGSRGLGGVRRMLLGSVSDFVVGHAPCSVMVVRADEAGKGAGG